MFYIQHGRADIWQSCVRHMVMPVTVHPRDVRRILREPLPDYEIWQHSDQRLLTLGKHMQASNEKAF